MRNAVRIGQCFLAMSVCAVASVAAQVLHVSPRGDVVGDGSRERPFTSIIQARDAIRKLRVAGGLPDGGVVVRIQPGTYRLTAPVVFQPEDSGTKSCPIVYEAAQRGTVVLSGGVVIDGWSVGKDNEWHADVPADAPDDWYFQQLFVDGRRCVRARMPNEGTHLTAGPLPEIEDPKQERKNPAAKIGFRYRCGDLKKWAQLQDLNIVLFHAWTASVHWIEQLDEDDCIVRFTAPSHWPVGYWHREQRYYVENCRDALDAPGEWYLDRAERRVYYWPRKGEDLTNAVIVAPRLRKLVVFDGDIAQGRFVEHITLRGLSLQHASWHVANRGVADGQAAAWLEAAVMARGARHCGVVDCEVAHVGEYGIYLERGCQHDRIERCYVHDLGAGGVRLGFMQSPKGDADRSGHNTVDNCLIADGGHVFHAGVGVWIGRSSHNVVTHCEIRDFDYTGVSVGWCWGYAESTAHHNEIAHNYIHDIGRGVLSDMGGVYLLGVSPGTTVHDNVIHDVESHGYGGWGLYTDEGSSEIVLERNLVYDTKTGGFHQHYGKDNIVRNNIFAFATEWQLQRTREEPHQSFRFERNILVYDRGRMLRGRWRDGHYHMDHNIYWHYGDDDVMFGDQTFAEWQQSGRDVHSRTVDPDFVDPHGRDFSLKPGSPAHDMGFVPLTPSRAGLRDGNPWKDPPDTP